MSLENKKMFKNMHKIYLHKLPRKFAMSLFLMETGCDCLAEHVHRIDILPTPLCTICNEDNVLNRSHLYKVSDYKETIQLLYIGKLEEK